MKVGTKVAYRGRRWQAHVASAFPLSRSCQVFWGEDREDVLIDSGAHGEVRSIMIKVKPFRRSTTILPA
jgi:hypothetical protein